VVGLLVVASNTPYFFLFFLRPLFFLPLPYTLVGSAVACSVVVWSVGVAGFEPVTWSVGVAGALAVTGPSLGVGVAGALAVRGAMLGVGVAGLEAVA